MIYICIPAYNEERTVGVVLWKIRQVMAGFPRDYQLLVADDGSTDDTAEVLSPYQRVLPLTVVKLEKRSGYASALELLMREAVRRAEYPKRDVIITLQADFTDDPDELLGLLKRIEAGADIVAANAALPALAPRSLRWPRQVGNFMLRRRGLPESVLDPLCGLRAYRLIVVKRAMEGRANGRLLTWDGWAANSELLQLTQPHSRRTEAIDIIYRSDRQQRPSRNTLWPLLMSVVRHSRGGSGPLADLVLPTPAATDSRERSKPGRHVHGRKEADAPRDAGTRDRSRNGRGNGRGQHGPDAARSGTRRDRRPDPLVKTDEAAPQAEGRPKREGRPPRQEGRPQREGRTRDQERRRKPAKAEQQPPLEAVDGAAPLEVAEAVDASSPGIAESAPKKRRRRKRRSRSGRTGAAGAVQTEGAAVEAVEVEGIADVGSPEGEVADTVQDSASGTPATPRKRRSRRGGRGRRGRGRAPGRIEGSTQEDGSEPAAGESEGPAPAPPPPHPVESESS